MKEHQQVNFKLPKDLYDALKGRIKQGDATATDLVIQGLKHVLGLSSEPNTIGIESDIYDSIHKLEARIAQVESSSSIYESLHERIASLEDWIRRLEEKQVESNIYARLYNLEEHIEELKNGIKSGIASDIDSGIDSEASSLNDVVEELPTPENSLTLDLEVPSEEVLMTTTEVLQLEPGLKPGALFMRRQRKKLPTKVGNFIVDDTGQKRGKEIVWTVKPIQEGVIQLPTLEQN